MLFACFILPVFAQPGDTTLVQTYTFEAQNNPNTDYDSPGRRWFQFPSSTNGVEYQKILMYHTLKCFEDGTAGGLGFPCGEWDYLAYNYLYEHTGVFDSTFTWHPKFLINNQHLQTASLRVAPVVDTYQYINTYTSVTEELSSTEAVVGEGASPLFGPYTSDATKRLQYLIPASELQAAGLVAGEIDQMRIAALSSAGMYFGLTIQVRASTSAALNTFDTGSFTTVYSADTEINAATAPFYFQTPFVWNGTSGLVLQISYSRFEGLLAAQSPSDALAYNCGITSVGTDKYILFDGQDKVNIPAAAFETLSDQVTISFWQYGTEAFQPEDGTCFEGVNAANQRVLNTHLPWSNGRVYWDAGWSGNYDRIDKAAVAANYEGRWNHWAFTKDASTGVMRIFLNGSLWHTGTNKFASMADIVKFSIGAASGWSNFYRGSVDEFAIFNTALDAATINAWRLNTITDVHPAWNNLMVYYTFDEENNAPILDHSGNGHHPWISGNPQRLAYLPTELFKNPQVLTERPQITFYQGDYVTETSTSLASYAVESSPLYVEEFTISNYAPSLISSTAFYLPGQSRTFAPDGSVLATEEAPSDTTFVNDSLWYYQRPFEVLNRYELGRFITPYGIQLDMGEGWTWVYDVTDFATLLRDSVELECGNWQELLDLKFAFIEGTPAREVKRIENVWRGDFGLSVFDQNVTPRTFTLNDDEEELKLRTTVTGHGFGFNNNNCGEFCYNTHSVSVNNTSVWEWEIMEECDRNPLFPQGGTWIYARAGWCPGAPGTTQEFELTPYVQNNQVSADYSIEFDPFGNYVTESQMVYYGAKNFQHDAEIDRILAPSDFLLNSRFNPICDNPKFVLRNKGAQPLTQVTFSYRVNNGSTQTYVWSGNLGFMESEEIEVTYTDDVLWQGNSTELNTFYLDITSLGNGADENLSNNHAESTFRRPVVYSYLPNDADDNRLIIVFKTNVAFTETKYTFYDQFGNIVFARDDFDAPNTVYRDTLTLNAGCYTFHMEDADGDGLQFFANNDGNGYCRFDRVEGSDFVNFERDFGREIVHQFVWQTDLVNVAEMDSEVHTSLRLFPNPTREQVQVSAAGLDRRITVNCIDLQGRVVKTQTFDRRLKNETVTFTLQDITSGLYLLKVSDSTHSLSTRLVKE